MIERKTGEYRSYIKDNAQLYGSAISLDINFYDVEAVKEDEGKYRIIFFWIHPCGKSVKSYSEVHTSIHSNNLDELKQLLLTLALLMEKQNGVISIRQNNSVSPEIARLVEGMVEDVSILTNAVFWYCIEDAAPHDREAKKKYFDYLGVTEEEWLLL